ncbi:S1C family serine protease [Allorhodopirellula solitaria]|uniref:Periplasmic serine endoprotease DegP n=1 Tax=Allorhodopirellula solitaria TaxID=2527987 RepID=A0A5C5XT66_9BACT|nr:trypsin-like peptidase domain-containing protein [Allorhodopirellula solitaria]TWT66100.1 Periplasmic serine endoprotease DegP precursor [Allorhodopirellula solitaria]
MFPICQTTAHGVPTALATALLLMLACPLPTGAQEIVTLPSAGEDAIEQDMLEKEIAEQDVAEQESVFKSDARALSIAFRHAAREATPAVVTVYSYGQNSQTSTAQEETPGEAPNDPTGDETFGPQPPSQTDDEGYPLTGLGSGVLVNLLPTGDAEDAEDADSSPEKTYWVMTNNHVITNAKRVVVQLPDESELVAESVYGDPASDIAVLRLLSERDLATATLGDSDPIEIGDWVLAIGSPFKLEATVCAGIISAKHRSIGKIRRGRLFQTDAAINPGNSGGPLVDLDGKVVAISTAIATRNGGYQGIGFAIPINQAHWIARELAQYQQVRRAAMGVRLAELNPKLADKLDLPTYLGVLVHQVITDSAADAAGLQSRDVIMEFAGQRVRRMSALQQAVEQQPIGSTQDIKIWRAGKELTKRIVLAPLEDPTAVDTGEDTEE